MPLRKEIKDRMIRQGMQNVKRLHKKSPAERSKVKAVSAKRTVQSSQARKEVHLIEVKYCEDTKPGHQLEASSKSFVMIT